MSWLWLRESLFSVPAAAIAEASKPCVIAVAAVSGGGKTSAANALRERLTDAVALYFDDYDTPLDVAMARRMLRDYRESALLNLASEMKGYQEGGRRAYLEMLRVVLPSSDCSIDGTSSVNEITEEILERVHTLRSERSNSYESS